MASILSKWINTDVKLSIEVEDFEGTFSSGYYIAELLWKLDCLATFPTSNFINNNEDALAVITNFEMLKEPLNDIGITITKNKVREIIFGARGAAVSGIM